MTMALVELRQRGSVGAGCAMPARGWNQFGVGSLLSLGRWALAHAADAPALWARHCIDGGLCAPGVVCAAWLSCGDSRCAWTRRLRRRVLSISQRGQGWGRNDRLVAQTLSLQWAHWDVWVFLPGCDAAARGRRTAGRSAVHRAAYDRGGSVSRMVLSQWRVAAELESWMGNANVARGCATLGFARSKQQT